MKGLLSRGQRLSIFIAILTFHAIFLIMLLIAQMHQHNQQQPTIMFEQEEAQTVAPANDWVALNNSVPAPQQQSVDPAPPADLQKNEEKSAETNEPPQSEHEDLSDNAIDDALVTADQLLAQMQPSESPQPQKKQLNPIEPHPSPPAPEIKASSPEKELNFADLAQGFVTHMQQAAMAVKSNQQGTASMEQLKHLHFCQKIIGCVVNAYKINKGSVPHNKTFGTNARIQLSLNKDGHIALLSCLQSSGNSALDRFLLYIFQDANSSFPPLPAAFETPYHLPIFNIEHLEAFESTNGWYIDNRMG